MLGKDRLDQVRSG